MFFCEYYEKDIDYFNSDICCLVDDWQREC